MGIVVVGFFGNFKEEFWFYGEFMCFFFFVMLLFLDGGIKIIIEGY